MKEKNIKEIVEHEYKKDAIQLLDDVGILPHMLGYKYWTTALLRAIEKDPTGMEIPKLSELYKDIGKRHKATASKVERDMRYSILYSNIIHKTTNKKLLVTLKDALINKNSFALN